MRDFFPSPPPKVPHLERLARQGCPDDGGWIWPPLTTRRNLGGGWLLLIAASTAWALVVAVWLGLRAIYDQVVP